MRHRARTFPTCERKDATLPRCHHFLETADSPCHEVPDGVVWHVLSLPTGFRWQTGIPSALIYPNQNQDPLNGMSPAPKSTRKGVIGQSKQALSLGEINNHWYASVQINSRDYSVYFFHDQAKLLAYLQRQCGEIVW
jgi:hypothetical protein